MGYPTEDKRKFVVRTQSGSVYHFDNEAGTWDRKNQNAGHENILYMDGVHSGRLAAPVEPIVGRGLTFFIVGDTWIHTTPVVSVEEV